MKIINLPKGNHAIVDDEDYEKLSEFSWWNFQNGNFLYARTRSNGSGFLMHRKILGVTNPKIIIDHKNMNGLDNRKENLRIVSRSENGANTVKRRGISRYKGVSLQKDIGKWRAYATVTVNGIEKQVYLGVFQKEEDAALAYNAFAKNQWGDCARLNSIDGQP